MSSSNPFATKFIRAGELAFQFSEGDSAESLLRRLRDANWRGQIVGPHGSGKTTLLRSLEPHWQSLGRRAVTYLLRDQQRSLGDNANSVWRADSNTQLIVDGYEQLSPLSKCKLVVCCRLRRCGLLITTHQPTSLLPIAHRTSTSVELACELASQLLIRHKPSEVFGPSNAMEGEPQQSKDGPSEEERKHPPGSDVWRSEIRSAFAQHHGNLRETFLSLYDVYQAQSPCAQKKLVLGQLSHPLQNEQLN